MQHRPFKHKRSRRGCLTCRVRRKKCPEDFKSWPSGVQACSACFRRGQNCRMPSANRQHSNRAAESPTSSSNTADADVTFAEGEGSLPNTSVFDQSSPSSLPTRTPKESAAAATRMAPRPASSGLPPMTPSATSAASLAAGTLLEFQGGAPIAGGHRSSTDSCNTAPQQIVGSPHDGQGIGEASVLLSGDDGVGRGCGASGLQTLSSLFNSAGTSGPTPFDMMFDTQQGLSDNLGQPLSNYGTQGEPWLDDFFEVIRSMTEGSTSAVPHGPSWPPSFAPSAAQRNLSHSMRDTAPGVAPIFGDARSTVSAASPFAPFGNDRLRDSSAAPGASPTDSTVDRAVQLHDLDELLTRCSQIYERYMCAILDTTQPLGSEDGRPIMDHLMEITKSSTVCKASMVSCCLAYRCVILREINSTTEAPSNFVKYLTKTKSSLQTGHLSLGTVTPTPDSSNSSHRCPLRRDAADEASAAKLARAWLTYAMKEHQRQTPPSLHSRLLTLLNLRYACVCLLGARESFSLAPQIEAALRDLEADVGFLQTTSQSGTTLAFLTQALAAANVMDAAAVRGVRCSILDHPPSHPTLLTLDAEKSPRARYKYVTSLSVDLLACIKQITDLSADIVEGKVRNRAALEARAKAIETAIVSSKLDLSCAAQDGTVRLRAQGLHEMWRQAIFIHLYQDVFDLGPMAAKMQRALQQILQLWHMLGSEDGTSSSPERDRSVSQRITSPAHNIDVWDMSMVWFLAGTVAMTESHRAACLAALRGIGSEAAILDNVEVLKMLWRHADETGRLDNWKQQLLHWKRAVCYTF